jgi:DNA-binding FadR family transcriptional regulator
MRRPISLLVNRVTQDLRKLALNAPPGTFLGSTDELLDRLNVSRPTFRQAAKVLEQEQLLVVKTGIGGGYFVSQPDTAAVAHMTDIYLQSQKMELKQVLPIFAAFYVLIARAAAMRHNDGAALAELLEFAQSEQGSGSDQSDWETHVSRQLKLTDILVDLSGNPLTKLFFIVTREMFKPFYLEKMTPPKPEQIVQGRNDRIRLIEVILAGEAELAEVVVRRYMAKVENWITVEKAANGSNSLGASTTHLGSVLAEPKRSSRADDT